MDMITFSPCDLEPLIEEQLIWEHAYENSKDIAAPFAAHWDQRFPTHYHYNCLMPLSPFKAISKELLKSASTFYSSKGVIGHVPVPVPNNLNTKPLMEDYYLTLAHPARSKTLSKELRDADTGKFSRCVRSCFDLDEDFVHSFSEMLRRTQSKVKTQLKFLQKNGTTQGCFTLFHTKSGNTFIMNVGTLPEFRKQGIGHILIQEAVNCSQGKAFIQTSNPAMINILEKAGFTISAKIGFYRIGDILNTDY